MILDRRGVLVMCASLGTLMFPQLSQSQMALPGGTLRAFLRMRGLGTHPVAIGCLQGVYTGVVDGAVTPLFGVVSATFTHYREVEGGFEMRSAELAYFTDLDTDTVLETWKNPYTNQVVSVPTAQLPPTTARIGTDLRIISSEPVIPGVQLSQSVSQPQMVGKEIWFNETIVVVKEAGATQPAFHYYDSTVLRARLPALDNQSTAPVRSETSFESVVSWRTWLKMGAHPGCMVGFGNGFYGASIRELPPAWLKATEIHRPEILANPEKILASNGPRPG
jgi:hypothetical protein